METKSRGDDSCQDARLRRVATLVYSQCLQVRHRRAPIAIERAQRAQSMMFPDVGWRT